MLACFNCSNLVPKVLSLLYIRSNITTPIPHHLLFGAECGFRNFFMGRELTSTFGVLRMDEMDKIAHEEMKKIGIEYKDTRQADGTISPGQRQTLPIARAINFAAKDLLSTFYNFSHSCFDELAIFFGVGSGSSLHIHSISNDIKFVSAVNLPYGLYC